MLRSTLLPLLAVPAVGAIADAAAAQTHFNDRNAVVAIPCRESYVVRVRMAFGGRLYSGGEVVRYVVWADEHPVLRRTVRASSTRAQRQRWLRQRRDPVLELRRFSLRGARRCRFFVQFDRPVNQIDVKRWTDQRVAGTRFMRSGAPWTGRFCLLGNYFIVRTAPSGRTLRRWYAVADVCLLSRRQPLQRLPRGDVREPVPWSPFNNGPRLSFPRQQFPRFPGPRPPKRQQ